MVAGVCMLHYHLSTSRLIDVVNNTIFCFCLPTVILHAHAWQTNVICILIGCSVSTFRWCWLRLFAERIMASPSPTSSATYRYDQQCDLKAGSSAMQGVLLDVEWSHEDFSPAWFVVIMLLWFSSELCSLELWYRVYVSAAIACREFIMCGKCSSNVQQSYTCHIWSCKTVVVPFKKRIRTLMFWTFLFVSLPRFGAYQWFSETRDMKTWP